MLGNRDIMDTPFSVTSYTAKTIADQQARTVGDVLLNDASVRQSSGFGNFSQVFVVRGFQLYLTKYPDGPRADNAGYWLGEKVATTSTARKEGDGHGLSLLYANGPFSGALTTQSVQRDASGGKVRTSGVGLAYDFGIVKPYFVWSQDKESGTVGNGKARTWAVSAEIRLNPVNTVAISYADRDESDGATGEDARGWSAYYLHALSKRTTLYAGYTDSVIRVWSTGSSL